MSSSHGKVKVEVEQGRLKRNSLSNGISTMRLASVVFRWLTDPAHTKQSLGAFSAALWMAFRHLPYLNVGPEPASAFVRNCLAAAKSARQS